MTFIAQGEYLDRITLPTSVKGITYVLVDAEDNVVFKGGKGDLKSLSSSLSVAAGEEYRLYPSTYEEFQELNTGCAESNCAYSVEFAKKTTPATLQCEEMRDASKCGQAFTGEIGHYAEECAVCMPEWSCTKYEESCAVEPVETTLSATASVGFLYGSENWVWGDFTAMTPTNLIKSASITYTENEGAPQPLPAQFETMRWQWIWFYDTLGGPGEEAAVTTGNEAQNIPIQQGRWFRVRAYGDAISVADLVTFCMAPSRSCGFTVIFDETKFTSVKTCTEVKDTANCGVGFFGSLTDYDAAGTCAA